MRYAVFSLRAAIYGKPMADEMIFFSGNKKYIALQIKELSSDPMPTPGIFWFTIEEHPRIFNGHETLPVDGEFADPTFLDIFLHCSREIYCLANAVVGVGEPVWLRIYANRYMDKDDRRIIFEKFFEIDVETLMASNPADSKTIIEFWISSIHSCTRHNRLDSEQTRALISTIHARIGS